MNKQAVYVINADDREAMAAVREIFSRPMKPGMVIPLSGEQYEALQRSMIVFVPPPVEEAPMSRADYIRSLTAKDRGTHADE